jgi:CDP-diacylglycerol--glycerol-3-phosphate 3-phosphatidyltransferase
MDVRRYNPSGMKINLPNQITLGRLALAVVFFALLSCFNARELEAQRWLLNWCFWVFLVAALADVLDGLLARMMRSVTSFGRILDPVVDKVLVCGAFVLFASYHFSSKNEVNIAGVYPWMAVVILARELLVSAVRSHAEAEGREFGAFWFGKLKMFVQSATVCVVLGQLAWDVKAAEPIRVACVWLTVIITILSGIPYIRRARAFLLTSAALGGTRPDAPTADTSPPAQPAPDTADHAQGGQTT